MKRKTSDFYLLLALTVFFFAIDWGSSFLLDRGITHTKVGGESASKAYLVLGSLALTVFKDEFGGKPDVPPAEPPKAS